ncbi:MAG: hypothetical protein KGZ74_16280 [Chitinophagaceae bacterium]|jgi:predicted DNA-binding protein|nr:hypothetical protein [Chitinophagaceae bacterium]
METLIIETKSKETTKLLVELSKQLKLKHKKVSIEDAEDFFLAQAIKKGLKSGNSSRDKVMKVLKG